MKGIRRYEALAGRLKWKRSESELDSVWTFKIGKCSLEPGHWGPSDRESRQRWPSVARLHPRGCLGSFRCLRHGQAVGGPGCLGHQQGGGQVLTISAEFITKSIYFQRARAWCSMAGITYVRLCPMLASDIRLDETSDEVINYFDYFELSTWFWINHKCSWIGKIMVEYIGAGGNVVEKSSLHARTKRPSQFTGQAFGEDEIIITFWNQSKHIENKEHKAENVRIIFVLWIYCWLPVSIQSSNICAISYCALPNHIQPYYELQSYYVQNTSLQNWSK